jgi:type VI secretion system protein
VHFTVESRSAVRPLILAMVLLATASCGLPNRVRSMFGGQLPIQVTISPDANEDSPLAVELIVAYDQKIVDELLKMKARQWFSGREQFLRDHPEALDSWMWEWTPGQSVAPLELSYGIGAKRVVLFADYLASGEHRATVDPQQPFKLVLGESDLTVEVVR